MECLKDYLDEDLLSECGFRVKQLDVTEEVTSTKWNLTKWQLTMSKWNKHTQKKYKKYFKRNRHRNAVPGSKPARLDLNAIF